MSKCKGMNCGATDGISHSAECEAEHAASVAGGVFVKQPVGEVKAVEGIPIPTGHAEADRIIGRLMSSDPDFQDCTDAAALIQREICGPDGFATWREAALAERIKRTPQPVSEVPMPKPVAYGFGNTAITGHTNRLMMVRIDIPGGDQYAGAFWLPLVLADEAHTYGVACRAAGYSRAANWLRVKAEKHAEENGYHEPDTGAFVFASRAAEEWNNSVLELADEMEAALRGELK